MRACLSQLGRHSCLHIGLKFLLKEHYLFLKGCLVEESLCIICNIQQNLNFRFLSLYVCLFKNCPFQFFSLWKSAEPVFAVRNSVFLFAKTKTKVLIRKFISVFSSGPRFDKIFHQSLHNRINSCEISKVMMTMTIQNILTNCVAARFIGMANEAF